MPEDADLLTNPRRVPASFSHPPSELGRKPTPGVPAQGERTPTGLVAENVLLREVVRRLVERVESAARNVGVWGKAAMAAHLMYAAEAARRETPE